MMMSMFSVSFFLLLLLLGTPHLQLQSSLAFAAIPVLEKGPCKNQCEAVRDFYENSNNRKGNDFHFRCDHHYDNTTEDGRPLYESCLLACESCLPEICDEYVDANAFHCPPRELAEECKNWCDANRPNGKVSEYSFTCHKKGISADTQNCPECEDVITDDCASYCLNCSADYICDRTQIQRPEDNIIFHCPPLDPFSPRNKSYKGKCKERCEQSRGGGPFSFELNCESTFISSQEINHCLNVCNNECKICKDGEIIHCKTKNKEAAILEREKEEEKNRTRLERETELKDLMDTIDSNTTWISVLAMLIIIASFVSIGGVIVAWRVMDDDGERHQRPDKHTSALGRLFFRRKKEGHVIVPYQPLEAPSPASAQDAGVGPVILEE